MSASFHSLADTIAGTPGLIWKVWTENEVNGEGGGIYWFEDGASADAYLKEIMARLKSFGIEEIRVKMFDVNGPLSEITRAPVAR